MDDDGGWSGDGQRVRPFGAVIRVKDIALDGDADGGGADAASGGWMMRMFTGRVLELTATAPLFGILGMVKVGIVAIRWCSCGVNTADGVWYGCDL